MNVPIVVMSAAHRLHESAEHLRAQGVRDVLSKPFDLHTVLELIHGCMPPTRTFSAPAA
jgi:CheY-like chemotaxis protein